jgi:N-acetylmuramoyl-L-alanine amidase
MPKHIVKQGECISSIARRHGFSDWHTIYDDAQNRQLKKKRPNPHMLHPGDEVSIPEREKKSLSLSTGKVHEIKATIPKRRLKLVLRDGAGKVLANAPYMIEGVGLFAAGHTDDDGKLEQTVSALLQTARLSIAGYAWELRLGTLNPMSDTDDDGVSGVQGRLANLGFYGGAVDGVLGPRTRDAIVAFEQEHGLKVTGKAEGDFLDKLEEVHGS